MEVSCSLVELVYLRIFRATFFYFTYLIGLPFSFAV